MAEQIPDDKPLPPGDYECCESGCDRCVWDIYREDVAEWEAAQKAKRAQAESAPAPTPTPNDTHNGQ
ncbi:oxidoreductase-like domain-containing protein [Oceanobacter sp. 4_MG-2023]|uniref:oxidoreductase-like domain-containing protein n=1 Tax=Oceanobacter sp. 4_MG-2023 TaxID=3062623 RepID=UPI0027360F6A|nr:oxidoreductase-like domain-containing protein [Oceanobacter sp. 4_MG-2023]MDP2548617.1 oxidoreductase-like domain-containing protein [Oceanobacter sp. 4_MG-2023]